ncbi:MAG: ABC transporter permease [Alphaproteobacteria bacterium]|nr:ABC transporter permease [Alphaproteobacteria bacterium]
MLKRLLPIVGRRMWQGAITIVAIAIFNFCLIHMAPGSPVDVLAGESGTADPAMMEELTRRFNLDQPFHVQLFSYLWNMAQLNLGQSYRDNQPVVTLILARLPATLLLMASAIGAAFLFGLLLGVVSARFVGRAADEGISFFALVSYATPTFWSGLMLITLFSVKLGWLPSSGMMTIGSDKTGLAFMLDVGRHLILPTLSLSLFYMAIYTRLMRASMLEVYGLDYVRSARARGLSEARVAFRHVLRNALLPMVTMVGVQVGSILGGSVVVETVYGWPGLGRLAFESVGRRDYNLLLAILLFSSVMVIVTNLVVDIIYTLLDPRIEHGKK